MTFEGVPGLVERKDAYDETTLVVDPARLVEACLHLRDEEGFDFLSDITPVDYLGWGDSGVAGYFGTRTGRDLNEPASQGLARTPEPKRCGAASTALLSNLNARVSGSRPSGAD